MMTATTPRTAPGAVKIRRALISLSDKTGLEDLVRALSGLGVEIVSTGGTAKAIQAAGAAVRDVSAHTGFPEIMDGRVKTLHPKIHGGILARRDSADHMKAMKDNGIEEIDLIVVNLYPFAQTVASGADFASCIENIDIGGPSLIRAAAKNHDFLTVVTDPADYPALIEELTGNDGATSYALRKRLAGRAYALTAAYDSMISEWFAAQEPGEWPRHIAFAGELQNALRYGENPHQGAALYRVPGDTRPGPASARQLQGKEMSYNNYNDTDAAYALAAEFSEPAVAIIKHANPCGVAVGADPLEAYGKALACDPVSAFGGIIALNRPLTRDLAQAIVKKFVEVIIAPDIAPDALEVLAAKANIRVLEAGGLPAPGAGPALRTVRRIAGGLLVQDEDTGVVTAEQLKTVTKRAPTAQELQDLLFAFRVCKHVKSNAIVYARGGASVGLGAGQMSRLDSSRIAAQKMKEAGLAEADGALVVASDAFFPFADGLVAAAEAGVTAVIQPGGSVRDEEVIAAADERDIAMVFTGMRHFRH